MIKKIDSGNAVVIRDMGDFVYVTYSPKSAPKKLAMIKLTKAVLKFKVGAVAGENHEVFFVNKKSGVDEIIDVFNASNKEVCIDITDELQTCFSESEREIVLRITKIRAANISGAEVHFLYYFKRQVLNEQTTYSVDVGRAGGGNINLATGVFKFSFEDVKTNSKTLPISVRHTFNSLDAGAENELIPYFDEFKALPNCNCGKGWKNNFNQFVVKESNKEGTFSDNETSARYTYIDADGGHVLFEDKYYYENENGDKTYISADKVLIDQENELSFSDDSGKKEKVIRETKSDSGLTLVTKYENLKGLSLINQDNENVNALKEEIKSIEQARKDLKLQVSFYQPTLDLLEKSKQISEKNYNMQKSNLGGDNKDITEKGNDNTIVTGEANNNTEEAKPATEEPKKDLTKEEQNVLDQQNLLDDNINYADEQYNLEVTKLNKQNELYTAEINEYDKLLIQKKSQLKNLLAVTPEIFITDYQGSVFGFVPASESNVYKLLMVVDNYDNRIQIVYDGDKIEKIVDSDNNTLLFFYKNNLVETIEDTRQRKIHFEYDKNSSLTKVKYPSGAVCNYNYDERGNLIFIQNYNGYAYRLSYIDGKVVHVEQVNYAAKITQDSIETTDVGEIKNSVDIDYYDCESTRVTDLPTNKSSTYVFDTLGRIINKYDNVFENGSIIGNVNALSFERADEKSSFAIKELAYAENLLTTLKIQNNKLTVSESYMGSEAICGEDVVALNMEYDNSENEIYVCDSSTPIISKVLTNELISKIKNKNITDLILSGWAKADSAWVKRRNTDYCGACEESGAKNSLEQMIVDSMDDCKERRRFELRAKLIYRNNNRTKEVEQYCSFDWMNTEWQYCAFPVTLSENSNDELTGLEVYFDYGNNTGSAKFYGMSLKCGEWEYAEYKDGAQTYAESSGSDYITEYRYNDRQKLVKSITRLKFGEKEFVTTYDYNEIGELVRSIDYKGIVTENVYNEKGSKIKSVTYNITEPSNKFRTEEEIDEKGQKVVVLNEFGEKISHNTFIDKTGIVETTINKDGSKISYGYDVYDDKLLQMTTTVDDKVNVGSMRYNGDLLTSVGHNNIEITFEYNGSGQPTKTNIAGKLYSSTEYCDIIDKKTQVDGSEREVVIGQKAVTNYAKNDCDTCAEQFTTYTDIDGNLLKVEFGSKNGEHTVLTENRYDRYGNLIYTKDNELCSEIGIYYDELGRVTKKTFSQDGANVSIKNDYDKFGNTKNCTVEIGGNQAVSAYEYDYSLPDSKLKSISFGDISESCEFDKLDRLCAMKLGNLYSKQFNYLQKGDCTSNLIAAESFGVDGVINDSFRYGYDDNGNITEVFQNGVEIVRYTYDSLNRLIREDNKKLDKTTTFVYDCGGNIERKTSYAYTLKATKLLTDGNGISYLYPDFGWRDRVAAYGDDKFEYDVLGNPTKYRNNVLQWSHRNRLDKFNDIEFKYDGDGVRISKTVNNVKTAFYNDGAKILAQDNGNFLMFRYGSEGIIGFTYQGVGEYYYKKNIFGDIIAVIDRNGVEIVRYVYDAWGNHRVYALNDNRYVDIAVHLSYTQDGLNNKLIAEINPFRYRSYYYDSETGLYSVGVRYYDPELARWINSDSIDNAMLQTDRINGLNLYAFCLNNPVNYFDPTGGFVLSLLTLMLIGLGVGVVLGAGTSIITQAISNQSWADINWGQVAFDGLLGGISGALSVSSLGMWAMAGIGAGLGAIGSIGGQFIKNGSFNDIRWGDVVFSAAIGGIVGAIGGEGALNVKKLNKYAERYPTDAFRKAAASYDKVLTKIAAGGYKNLAGAAGARSLTVRALNAAWNELVVVNAGRILSESLLKTAFAMFGFAIAKGYIYKYFDL